MINPIRPWPTPGISEAAAVREATLAAAASSLMPAVVDRIMENRPSPAPTLLCRTCGHEWGNHQDGRCAHLFGMEGDFAHVCGCSPDERGEAAEAVGSAAAVAAAAAAIMALYR